MLKLEVSRTGVFEVRPGPDRISEGRSGPDSCPVRSGPPGPDFWQKWSKMEEAESNFEKNVHFLFNK